MSLLNSDLILWEGRKRSWKLGDRTLIMGILNVTPDSFFDGGRYMDLDIAVKKAVEMEEDGADIIDIGGESTRPGADTVLLEEELARVIPVVKELSKAKLKAPISVDTTKAEVARQAVEEGAEIINDVSAFGFDPLMAEVAAHYKTPVVLMHMRGRPENMQYNTHYNDIFLEMYGYFLDRINYAVETGVKRESIAIDPGIGFGKDFHDNLALIKGISRFGTLGRPVVLGVSRKSFIGHVLGLSEKERIEGTAAAVAVGAWEGSHIMRVHDVKEMKRVAAMVDAIKSA